MYNVQIRPLDHNDFHRQWFALGDANGNITEYIDDSGIVVAHYEYNVSGVNTSATGPLADLFRFRFSSKYLCEETPLYYYGNRYLEPELGCWLSRDPIVELASIPNQNSNDAYRRDIGNSIDKIYVKNSAVGLAFSIVLDLGDYYSDNTFLAIKNLYSTGCLINNVDVYGLNLGDLFSKTSRNDKAKKDDKKECCDVPKQPPPEWVSSLVSSITDVSKNLPSKKAKVASAMVRGISALAGLKCTEAEPATDACKDFSENINALTCVACCRKLMDIGGPEVGALTEKACVWFCYDNFDVPLF